MKPLLMAILLLALFAGSLLAFSGSTASARDDSSVRTADDDKTADAEDETENKTETRTAAETERTAATEDESADRTSTVTTNTDDTDTKTVRTTSTVRTREESDKMSERNKTVRTIEDADKTDEDESKVRVQTRAVVMSARTAWNATEAGRRCAAEDSDDKNERCLMKMANASLYAKAELREVNETKLLCANASSLRARVSCRMEIPKEEQEEGLYYLPEECRELDGEEKRTCLARYDAIQPCRFEKGDDARFKCVRERIGINNSAKELVAECKRQMRGNGTNADVNDSSNTNSSLDDNERGIGACVSEVRAQVFEESKFRIYNLEEKAERLSSYGVSNATIADFVTLLEGYKARFVAAEDAQAKKEVLRQVEAAWKEFVQKARAEAQANREMERADRQESAGRNASGSDEGAQAS